MKKLLGAIILSVPMLLHAQQTINLPVVCENSDSIGKSLKEYKEELLFVGKDSIQSARGISIGLFLNSKSGTYTIMFIDTKLNVMCVVSSGENGKLIYNN